MYFFVTIGITELVHQCKYIELYFYKESQVYGVMLPITCPVSIHRNSGNNWQTFMKLHTNFLPLKVITTYVLFSFLLSVVKCGQYSNL
jgi:hypothetical protein